MTITKLLRASAGIVVGLSLTGGVAAAQSGDLSNTGPDSTNTIKFSNSQHTDVDNHNSLSASNDNDQNAYSGDASVKHNTTGGDATSGDATNDNSFDASVTVDNSGSACGCAQGSALGDPSASIDTTGPDSRNEVKFENHVSTNVDNYNNVSVRNNNDQRASTGDASVYDNTTGGNATSGSASNSNSSSVTLSVTN